jgi:hypothetical protein
LYQKNAAAYPRYCVRCGRKLKSARSVGAGIGPKCQKKEQGGGKPHQALLFDEEDAES